MLNEAQEEAKKQTKETQITIMTEAQDAKQLLEKEIVPFAHNIVTNLLKNV